MPRILSSGSWNLIRLIPLLLAGCSASPQSIGVATSEEAAALQTLERFTASATSAIHAIDQARAVTQHNLINAHVMGHKAYIATLREGGKIDVQCNFSQGSTQVTSRPLDVMIEGPGFFVVNCGKLGDGDGYVRLGSFFINDRGELCLNDANGWRLEPRITVPAAATSVTINTDGRLFAAVPGSSMPQVVGQIQLARFLNDSELMEMEPGVFQRTETSGQPTLSNPGEDGVGTLIHGALEASNVDVIAETIRLAQLDQWGAVLACALKIPG